MPEVFGVPFEPDGTAVANGALALLLGLFALLVGALAHFRGAARWYSLFGLSFGLSTFLNNINLALILPFTPDGWILDWDAIPARTVAFGAVLSVLQAGLLAATAFAIARLMAAYGVDAPLRRPSLWAFPIALSIASIAAFLMDATLPPDLPWWSLWSVILQAASFNLAVGWMVNASVVMAGVYARDRLAGQAILAAAMSAYPIMWGVSGVATVLLLRVPVQIPDLYLLSLAAIPMAGAWWRVFDRTGAPAARRVAWLPPIWVAVAIAFTVWTDDSSIVAGLARAFDVLLVGYAILRLQYLGLDIKVRWGISKTTVAAVFVAVFFIASEAAQAFFGERAGNEYFGIAVAGTLVFASAPIMRWADRLAERAVPITMDPGEIFAAAVRAALADGVVSANEEMHLAKVAEGLGLTPTQVAAVRSRVGR